MLRRSPLLPFVLGLFLIYLAERSLADTPRSIALLVGGASLFAGVALAVVRRVRAARRADAESRAATGTVLAAYMLCLLALGLYAITHNLLEGAEHADLRTALTVAWPFVMLFGLVPAAAMELALASMVEAPVLELWRVRLAARAARIIVCSVVVFAGVNYAASQWNRKIDVSYFRTTIPSETTRTIAQSLAEPVRLILFAPPGNEVMEQASDYVQALASTSPQLHFEVVDQALAPDLARDMKVRQNGVLVFAKNGRSESLTIGIDMEAARGTLRKLDSEVQQRLLKMTRPPRTI